MPPGGARLLRDPRWAWYLRRVVDPIDELIRSHGPERVVAAIRPLLSEFRVDRIESVLDLRLTAPTAVFENLHDPHNGAAALRSIEALGLQEAHVVEAAEPFSAAPAVTMGCEKWLTLHHYGSVAGAAQELRARGFSLFAMLPGAARSCADLDPETPAALVFGNEHAGLSDEAIGVCDDAVSLPIHGFTQSFNLSVSVALAMSQVAHRRRQHLGQSGDLDSEERARLRARWYAMGVRGARAVVERHVSEETRP